MTNMKKIKNGLTYLLYDRKKFFLHVLNHLSFLFSDKIYIMIKYYLCFGKSINLKSPQTFMEKQNWLKLYDRNPFYTTLVDKVEVKKYVASIIGNQYIIPTLEVWDSVDEIDFDILPQQFVLKCNHNSGKGMYICKDKSKIDIDKVKKGLKEGLKENYYLHSREWPYKNVKRRILAEKYMIDSKTNELRDYKFFCFDGVVKALFVATDRSKEDGETKFDFFDADYNHLPFTNGHPNADILPEKPKCFEEMKIVASKLSKGIPSVRIDLYEIDGSVYFGEMTLTHWGGFTPFKPDCWDSIFGEWIYLPEINSSKTI